MEKKCIRKEYLVNKQYVITISEVISTEITVKAESIEEARAIAEEEIGDVFFEPQTPRRYVSSVFQKGVKL